MESGAKGSSDAGGETASPRRARVRRGARGASRIVSEDRTHSAFMSASTHPETVSPYSPRATGTPRYHSRTSTMQWRGVLSEKGDGYFALGQIARRVLEFSSVPFYHSRHSICSFTTPQDRTDPCVLRFIFDTHLLK